MSQEEQRQYEYIERQKLHMRRVRLNTRKFLNKYTEIMNNIQLRNLAQYIPEDYNICMNQVSNIDRYLDSDNLDDIFLARDISVEIKEEIYGLTKLAEDLCKLEQNKKALMEEEERALKIEAQNKHLRSVESAWNNELNNWDDPLARRFMTKEISTLKISLFEDVVNLTENKIIEEFKALKTLGKNKRLDYAENLKKDQDSSVKNEILEDTMNAVNQKAISTENKESLIEQLNALRNGKLTKEESSNQLKSIIQKSDDFEVEEDVRKEVAKTIIKTLNNMGLVVRKGDPRVNKNNEFVIYTKRPSGESMDIVINNNGSSINIDAHGYKGRACTKDTEDFAKMIEAYNSNISIGPPKIIHELPIDEDDQQKPLTYQTYSKE